MTRRTVALTVMAVWLGAMGWLVQQQYLRPSDTLLTDQPLNVSPSATYYRLELAGQQIGFASNLIDTLPGTLRVEDLLLLDVPTLGTVQRMEARTEALLSRTMRLRSFTTTVRGENVRFAARGTVEGDTLLQVEIESADSRQNVRVPLTGPIVLPSVLPLRVAFGGDLRIGRQYQIPVFDPVLMEARRVGLTVTAESTMVVVDSAAFEESTSMWIPARWDTLHTWRVRQTVGGVETESWIDELGQVVRATTPVGFTMERTAFEIAYENFRRHGGASVAAFGESDIIRRTAIAAGAPLEAARLQRLRVRLGGVALEGFTLDGGWQTVHGDTLSVVQDVSLGNAEYRLPSLAPELQEYLRPEPLIQSGDPRIRAQARQIVGRERRPARAARLLTLWIHQNLDKRVTVSVPSAVEVLETRRGDCNEHTVLFVAMARAIGLPARTAAGLVYLDGRFYYHAWPEVFLSDWVPVDPTLGQYLADATHLRFTIGGLARQVELVRVVGRLSLDVVEAG